MIQYETSDILVGNTNIAEAIETSDDLLFSETYVVTGAKLSANKIHANYDLIIIGDLEAEDIEVNGELVVNGNLKAEKVRCLKLVCTGKTQVGCLLCDEDVLAKFVTGNSVHIQGSLLVTDTIIIDDECSVDRNIMAGEGISGSGILHANSTIVGEYFDFDGNIETNVYEIATMFESVVSKSSESDDSQIQDYDKRLEKLLDNFLKDIIQEEEDTILEEISKCAKVQKVSFEELYYLFCEIDRISYVDKICNLRDCLLVKYAENVFPESILTYETVEHVFTDMIKSVDESELEYSAENLIQFIFSLKIVSTVLRDNLEEYADKIFSSIGLKYGFVKKQFERV